MAERRRARTWGSRNSCEQQPMPYQSPTIHRHHSQAADAVEDELVIVPRPRRLCGEPAGFLEIMKPRSRRCAIKEKSGTAEVEVQAGLEIMHIFTKKGFAECQSFAASNGCSPPSRAANPVIHDARFNVHTRVSGSPSSIFFQPLWTQQCSPTPNVRVEGFSSPSRFA